MLKLISCVFSLLLVGSIAVAGSQAASSPVIAAASIPKICSDQKAACTADCHDLFGNAVGICLHGCNVEYQQCIAGHQTLTGEDEAAGHDCDADASLAAEANTSPQVCYDQLQDCVVGCDGDDGTVDIGCTRQCVRVYQKCLGR